MIKVRGKYNTAKVFVDGMDDETHGQIIELLNQKFVADSQVRIMPDTHAGKGCVIGFTQTIQDKVVPNLVGVDIGCGMHVSNLGKVDIDFSALDKFIKNKVPHGSGIHKESQVNFKDKLNELICLREISKRARDFNLGIGSLGGGNHFIEANVDKYGDVYLVIHSGSRNLGAQVCQHYQKLAVQYHNGINDVYYDEQSKLIATYKKDGRKKEIQNALSELKKKFSVQSDIPDALCYLEGKLLNDYLHDLKIAQEYAVLNREVMSKNILNALGIGYNSQFHTIHNYIDLDKMILRKGAVSALDNELMIIPLNMRDGSILAYGKGNPDWNFSAPHGAGRLYSRTRAKELFKLDDFEESMTGIYTTSVRESTLDESPFAYKSMESIIDNVGESVEIVDIMRPLYNFKA
jgi:RNA-splicing ligase RtcB